MTYLFGSWMSRLAVVRWNTRAWGFDKGDRYWLLNLGKYQVKVRI